MTSSRAQVTILTYHSVRGPHDARVYFTQAVRPAHFEQQMRYLATHTRVIPLGAYVDGVRRGTALPEDCTVLTFDDGYRDNLTQVRPILMQYGLPATFFLATDYIGTGRMLWQDRLSRLICGGRAARIVLELPGIGRRGFGTDNEQERLRTAQRLTAILDLVGPDNRQRVLDDLAAQTGAAGDEQEPGDLMLSWDEVRIMARTPGITLGAHTLSHPHLARLSSHEALREMIGSLQQVTNETGQPVRFFAYPHGDVPPDQGTALAQLAGFDAALTLEYGRNDLESNLFRLRRIQVPDCGGWTFGANIALRASGLGESLKRVYNRAWKGPAGGSGSRPTACVS